MNLAIARGFSALSVCFLLTCLCADLSAQPGGGFGGRGGGGFGGRSSFGGRGGGGIMDVARQDAVRSEVNLTDEQLKQLDEIQSKSREAMGALMGKMRSASDEEREVLRAEFEQARQKSEDEFKKLLKKEQYTRLRQVSLQQTGVRGLSDDAVASDLGLDDQQKEALAKLNEEYRSVRFSMFRASPEEREKSEQVWNAKFTAVLRADQQTKWTSMLGTKFDPNAKTAAVAPTSTGSETGTVFKKQVESGSKLVGLDGRPVVQDQLASFQPPVKRPASTPTEKPEAFEAGENVEKAVDPPKAPVNPPVDPPKTVEPPKTLEKPKRPYEEPVKKAVPERTPPQDAGGSGIPEVSMGNVNPNGKMSFNFRFAPWADVLELFAKRAGLTLDLNDTPPGSFNYLDDGEYTATETLDILNFYLLQKGYILVRRHKFLVAIAYDEAKGGIPPNLVPTVKVSELASRGKNELMRVIVKLDGIDPNDAAKEVEPIMGPQGRVVPLVASKSLMLRGIGSSLQSALEVLEGVIPPDADLSYKSYRLTNITAVDAENHVRSIFGLPQAAQNVSSSAERSRYYASRSSSSSSASTRTTGAAVTVAADMRTNSLLVKCSAEEHKIVDELISTIDVVQDPEMAKFAANNLPFLRAYKVDNSDATEVAKTLEQIVPGTVINEDGRSGFLHIKATATKHREIEELIRQMDGISSEVVEFIKLKQYDPAAMASMLNGLFLKDGDKAPVIQAETSTRSLIVRGSNQQVAQIRKTLLGFGEDGSGTGESFARRGGPFRSIPLGGRNAGEFTQMLESVLDESDRYRNRIRISIPSRKGPVGEQRVPSAPPETKAPVKTAPEVKPAADVVPEKTTRNRPSYNTRGLNVRQFGQPTYSDAFGRKAVEPPSEASTSVRPFGIHSASFRTTTTSDRRDRQFVRTFDDDLAALNQVADEAANSKQPVDAPKKATTPRKKPTTKVNATQPKSDEKPTDGPNRGPSVSIRVVNGELQLYSTDEAALDDIEDLIADLMPHMPVQNSWTVFYLLAADANEAASMIEQLMPESSVSTSSLSGGGGGGMLDGLTGGFSSLGSSLMDMTGLTSLTEGPQTVRIIPDARSNSLLVNGPAHLVNDVEDFIRILDKSDLPQSLKERVPRTIKVLHGDVNEIAAVVREIFKDFLQAPQQQRGGRGASGGGNPLAALMGAATGGGGGGAQDRGIRLTVAVDERTSELIVSASEALFLDVESVVKERDQAAKDARSTVRIVTLDTASAAVVQQALRSLSPKIQVSSGTTGVSRTRPTPQSTPDGQPQQQSNQQQEFLQQMMLRQQLQGGGFQPGGGGGRPTGGGAGGAPGGTRSGIGGIRGGTGGRPTGGTGGRRGGR